MQKYTKEKVIENIKLFIEKNKREPSSYDFNSQNGLPNRKTIERRFGGLIKFREENKLVSDHRKGKIRIDVANDINKRADKWNKIIYNLLLTYFKEPFIHKESSIFDDRRNRTDFKIYGKKTFLVDIFYPKDRHSLLGCILIKSKKYPVNLKDYMDKKFDKVIFLNLNDSVLNDNVNQQKGFTLMSVDEFLDYCKKMI